MTSKQLKPEQVMLDEIESKKLLKEAGIPVVETRLSRTKDEVVEISREIGFPVALKVISPDVVHKSDIGGVKVGLTDTSQVSKAIDEIYSGVEKNVAGARIEGISVQKMAQPGVEIIIGMNEDAQFGPVIMFGLGGVMVEALRDVSFRVIPITAWDAAEMIHEIRGFSLLKGFRGQEPVDIQLLAKLLTMVSKLVEKNPQIKELDINPLIISGREAVAVDARILVEL